VRRSGVLRSVTLRCDAKRCAAKRRGARQRLCERCRRSLQHFIWAALGGLGRGDRPLAERVDRLALEIAPAADCGLQDAHELAQPIALALSLGQGTLQCVTLGAHAGQVGSTR